MIQRAVLWEMEDGRVVLLVPRFGRGRIGRVLARILRKGPIRVRLDDVGSRAWTLFESGRTAGEVLDTLAAEGEGDMKVRLDTFLRQLHRSRCVFLQEPCE